jgi:hypothetical protein
MDIDADRLAQQVELAYDFIEALHGQAIALIRDVETQLEQEAELRLLQPGGYRYTINPQSYGLERPQVPIADFFAVFFRRFEGRARTTPLDGTVPPIGFVKVVFRERGLRHPEVRFGVLTRIQKPPERSESWPKKVEDVVSRIADRALVELPWGDEAGGTRPYEDSYLSLHVEGKGVRLAELPDSEAIAARIVDPLITLVRKAAQES